MSNDEKKDSGWVEVEEAKTEEQAEAVETVGEEPVVESAAETEPVPAEEAQSEEVQTVEVVAAQKQAASTEEGINIGKVINDTVKDISIDKDSLKNETTSTINEVRETIKKVNFKDDTEATKGFLLKFLKDPIGETKAVAQAGDGFFKLAVVLLIVWMAASFAYTLIWTVDINGIAGVFGYGMLTRIWGLVCAVIEPCLTVLVLAIIVLVLNKEAKKPLTAVIATVVIAKIPVIAAEILSLLRVISSQLSSITSPFSSICTVLSAVLLFFGLKEIFEEQDDSTFMKRFIVIMVIYFIVKFIGSFLSLSI